ncbi:MAG: hypothetical protein ACRDJY_00970 [Thermoleophilaceae bacterium]
MQIRRVLLLFALVLGLSALVASLAPPPEDPDEDGRDEAVPTVEQAAPSSPEMDPRRVSIAVRPARARPSIRRVRTGSSFWLTVSVPDPGDVVVEGLGLRQSADPLAPASFALLAQPRGRHAVVFVPVDGKQRVVGRLVFVDPMTVTQPQRGR